MDFREEAKEGPPQELSKNIGKIGKKEVKAGGELMTKGQTKAPPGGSIAGIAHQKKPSAGYDVDLGEFNEKEGNIYAVQKTQAAAPMSFNFEFQPTSSGFLKKKPDEAKIEKTQNFKAALSPPPKQQKQPAPVKMQEKPKESVSQANKKPSKLKEMFQKQKTKKEQKKEEPNSTVKIKQKNASPEPQIVFEDEQQPQSNLPPHFRVIEEEKRMESQRRKEELAAKNPALARFGDPSLFEQTPPPVRQDQFENFDFGSQASHAPNDKFSAEKKQDSFGELNALRFGGRFPQRKDSDIPHTYGGGGSIEMGIMNKREEEQMPNTHDDLIARRFGGALVQEEEEKIGSYQPPPSYEYDPYPMAAEEENRFEEGFSYTNAPEEPQWNYGEQDYNSEVSAPLDSDDSDDTVELQAPESAGGHLARFGGILSDPRFHEKEEDVKAYKSNENQQNNWRSNYMQDISLKDDYNLYYTHKKPNQQRPASQLDRSNHNVPQRPNPQPAAAHQPPMNHHKPYQNAAPHIQGSSGHRQGMPHSGPPQSAQAIKQAGPHSYGKSQFSEKKELNTSNPSQGSGDQRPRPISQLQNVTQKMHPPPQAQPRPYNPYAEKMQPQQSQEPMKGGYPQHAMHRQQHSQTPSLSNSVMKQQPGNPTLSIPPTQGSGKHYLGFPNQKEGSRNPQIGHSHQKSMPGPVTSSLQQNPYSRQIGHHSAHPPTHPPSHPVPNHPSHPPSQKQQPYIGPATTAYSGQKSGIQYSQPEGGAPSQAKPGVPSKTPAHDPFDFGIDLTVKSDRTASIHKNNPFM